MGKVPDVFSTKRIQLLIFLILEAPMGHGYLLEKYCGLDKKEIMKQKKMKSRWVTIFKHYPTIVLSERNVYMLSAED